MSIKIDFEETQKFTQWWIWLILIGLGTIVVFGFTQRVFVGVKFASKPMPDAGLIIFTLLMVGFINLNWYMTIITEISNDGI